MSSGDVQLQPRDERILDHVGRYRITLRPVLDQAFFATESSGSGNMLQRLMRGGYLTAREGLPGRRRYYQLTAKGAEGRVSLERTKPVRAQALRSLIAVLWFCHMLPTRAHPLEKWELRDAFEEQDPPPGTHCAVPGASLTVYRTQVPGTRTKPAAVISALKENLQDSYKSPLLKHWMKDRRYGFAILAESERASELRSAVNKHKLSQYAPVLVESVPGPQTLARAIHDHRVSQASK